MDVTSGRNKHVVKHIVSVYSALWNIKLLLVIHGAVVKERNVRTKHPYMQVSVSFETVSAR